MSPLAIFVAEGALLIALPYIAWRHFGLRHVAPLAVVQVMCGLALGPSVLGAFSPAFQHWLFPAANLAKLSGVATFAVVLITFLTGMHLDEKMVRITRPTTLEIALSSFLLPLVLGSGLGFWLATFNAGVVGTNALPWQFAFGFGICIAVTALPVLSAILREMKIIDSELGQQALGYAALQCPEHEHYHVQSENVLLEVLDNNGRPCRPGQSGRVVATTLHNFAMPLIRYDIGDYATAGEPCSCGRGLPVISRILGRVRNMLTLPTGGQVWPYFSANKLRDHVPIRQFQLMQKTLTRLELRIVPERPLTAEDEAKMRAVIIDGVGGGFTISFSYHDAIASGPSGKYEDFRSVLPQA